MGKYFVYSLMDAYDMKWVVTFLKYRENLGGADIVFDRAA
jgi:hypothetical protein